MISTQYHNIIFPATLNPLYTIKILLPHIVMVTGTKRNI